MSLFSNGHFEVREGDRVMRDRDGLRGDVIEVQENGKIKVKFEGCGETENVPKPWASTSTQYRWLKRKAGDDGAAPSDDILSPSKKPNNQVLPFAACLPKRT